MILLAHQRARTITPIEAPRCLVVATKWTSGVRSQNNNHHSQSASAEETFIAAFMSNDQYFFPCWKFASVVSENRRVQEGRGCRQQRKHGVGPRLCRAGSCTSAHALSAPIWIRFSPLFLFSPRRHNRRAKKNVRSGRNTVIWKQTQLVLQLFYDFI